MPRPVLWALVAAALLLSPASAQEPEKPRQEQEIRASGRQIEQCRACGEAIEGARREARALRLALEPPAPAWAEVAAQFGRLTLHTGIMEAEHGKLAAQLRPEQKTALKRELDAMQRVQKNLDAALAAIARELDAEAPSVRRLRPEVRRLERAILEWKMRQDTLDARLQAVR